MPENLDYSGNRARMREEALRQSVSLRQMGGVSVERVIYQWSAGQSLSDADPACTFKLVAGNHPIRARCWNPAGQAEAIGRLILTPPNSDVRGFATDNEDGILSTVFHLDGELMNRLLKQADVSFSLDDLETDLDICDPNIEASLLRLACEINRADNKPLVHSLLQLLIVDLARHVSSNHEALSINGGLRASQLKHIDEYLASFEIGLPTPAGVAHECGISPTHLRRLFKRSTGESLQNYIKNKRISRAKMLLADDDIPLKVVSYQVGFNHCSAFSFAFQQATGETPGQYRRRMAHRWSEAGALDTAAFHTARVHS